MEETKPRKYSYSIMTKNVTQFKHLLKNPCANQNDITWAINLRQYSRSPSKIIKQGSAPDVYNKKTKIFQIRQQQFQNSKDKGFLPFKCSEFSHMVPKFHEKTLKQSATAIQFFSSLRNGNKRQNKQNTNQFSTLPYKDRQQQPKIFKKSNIKKTKNYIKDDFESTIDGRQNFPHYSQKILRTKNYSLLKNFTQVKGRGKVTLPGLAWQIGLRNY